MGGPGGWSGDGGVRVACVRFAGLEEEGEGVLVGGW